MRVREKVGDLLAEEEGMPGAKRTTAHSVQPRAPSCGAAGPGSGLNTRHSTPTRSGTRPAPGPALAGVLGDSFAALQCCPLTGRVSGQAAPFPHL